MPGTLARMAAAMVRARLGATRLLLEQHQGTTSHESLSKLQAAALAQAVSEGSLSVEERSELAATAVQVKWASPDDLAKALAALTSDGGRPIEPQRRRRAM